LRAFKINEGFDGIFREEMGGLDGMKFSGLDLFVELFPRLN
jgi:hypothetical protein